MVPRNRTRTTTTTTTTITTTKEQTNQVLPRKARSSRAEARVESEEAAAFIETDIAFLAPLYSAARYPIPGTLLYHNGTRTHLDCCHRLRTFMSFTWEPLTLLRRLSSGILSRSKASCKRLTRTYASRRRRLRRRHE